MLNDDLITNASFFFILNFNHFIFFLLLTIRLSIKMIITYKLEIPIISEPFLAKLTKKLAREILGVCLKFAAITLQSRVAFLLWNLPAIILIHLVL